jgi:hypothetical protein
MNHYSLLDHLRHLLARDPELEKLGLHGGLGIWLLRNTDKLVVWSQGAQNAWSKHDAPSVRTQLVSILDYLDGAAYVQADVPPGTGLQVDPTIARVALLELDQQQDPPGYVKHIGLHLTSIANNPYATPSQKALASQLLDTLNVINAQFERMRTDAKRLVNMTDAQLLQPSSQAMLNDLAMQAQYAYNGRRDAATNSGQQEGVVQVYKDLQRLATFEAQPYTR